MYDVNGQLQKQRENIEKMKDRIPTCEAKIDSTLVSNNILLKTVIISRPSCLVVKSQCGSLNTKQKISFAFPIVRICEFKTNFLC